MLCSRPGALLHISLLSGQPMYQRPLQGPRFELALDVHATLFLLSCLLSALSNKGLKKENKSVKKKNYKPNNWCGDTEDYWMISYRLYPGDIFLVIPQRDFFPFSFQSFFFVKEFVPNDVTLLFSISTLKNTNVLRFRGEFPNMQFYY